jgi:hypothetical protein
VRAEKTLTRTRERKRVVAALRCVALTSPATVRATGVHEVSLERGAEMGQARKITVGA